MQSQRGADCHPQTYGHQPPHVLHRQIYGLLIDQFIARSGTSNVTTFWQDWETVSSTNVITSTDLTPRGTFSGAKGGEMEMVHNLSCCLVEHELISQSVVSIDELE